MESVAAPLRCSQPGWLAGRIYLGAFSDGDDDRKEGILYDILIYIYIYITNCIILCIYIYPRWVCLKVNTIRTESMMIIH